MLRDDAGRKVGKKLATTLALEPVALSLRSRGIRGSLICFKDRMYWRCTATGSDGSRKSRRVPLGLPAHAGQLLEAENRVVRLAAEMNKQGVLPDPLPWVTPALVGGREELAGTLAVAEAVAKLEVAFWEGKVRTAAAERTWDRLAYETRRLPAQAMLTMDLLVAHAQRTTAGSRSRLEACKVFKRLATLVGLSGVDRLDALRTPYEPGQRELPSEQELRGLLESLDPEHKYSWITWALVTYGCRPSEVFSLSPSEDGTARVLTVKRKGKQPVWRTAMALPIISEPSSRSTPWEITSPAQYDSLEAKRITSAWGKWLNKQNPGLQLYDIRHSWAIRSIRESIPTGLAAKCMGHDIGVHTKTYHRWLEQADVAAFVAKRAAIE